MKKIFNYYNLLLLIPLFFITTISLIDMYYLKRINMIYEYHFYKELTWVIIGFIFFISFVYIKPKLLLRVSPLIYIISIILLILVLFFGNNTNGSMAWFKFGFIKFQPSELMKLSLILLLSKLNNKKQLLYILKVFIITLIPSLLVFLEPDSGAVIIYLLIMLSFLFSSKVKKKYQISILIIGIIFSLLAITLYFKYPSFINHYAGYRINRIINLKNGYQIDNALTAIGSTKLIKIKPDPINIYIPEAHTDFIFAYTVSNLGFLSGLGLIVCYYLICIFINYKKSIISNTLLIIFSFQVIYNIGFNLGLLPIMGIPLPFLSYGGSNIIIYFILFGLLINMDDNNSYNHKNNQDYKAC